MALVASPAAHAFLESPQHSFTGSEQTWNEQEDVWGQLRKIFVDVGSTLSPNEEIDNIAVAEGCVQARDTERESIIDELQAELSGLRSQLAAASSSAHRPTSVPTPAEHNDQMRLLEQQHYATGKALNEEQAAMGKKEIELGRWRVEREEVGGWAVGEDEGLDSRAIRLRLLNDIGFRLLPAEENTAAKIVIRNDAKDDVHTASIDRTRTKSQWANLMWNLASEQ